MSIYLGSNCVDFVNTTTNVAPKPYDSKIEYLEGDGLAFIDTGISATPEMTVQVYAGMRQVEDSTDIWPAICGMRGYLGSSSDDTQRYCIRLPNDLTTTGYTGGVFQKSPNSGTVWTGGQGPQQTELVNHPMQIVLNGNNSYCNWGNCLRVRDSLTMSGYGSGFETFKQSLYIFDIHLADGTHHPYNNGKYIRIYQFDLIKQNTVLHLIPVRVGQVGYLYDSISGQLYGNANTEGAFVLGPDIN